MVIRERAWPLKGCAFFFGGRCGMRGLNVDTVTKLVYTKWLIDQRFERGKGGWSNEGLSGQIHCSFI